MQMPRKIWRSKLWAKRGDTHIIIHVIAEVDSVGFRIEAVRQSGKASVVGAGTASSVFAARAAAESLAAKI